MATTYYMRGFNSLAPGTVGFVSWTSANSPDPTAAFVPGPYVPGNILNVSVNYVTQSSAALEVDQVKYSLIGGNKLSQQTIAPGEVLGGSSFHPASIRPGIGFTRTITFNCQAYTTLGTAEVTLFDLTNNVNIATLTTTSTSPVKLTQSLAISSPGVNTISTSEVLYEVRSRFSAGSPGVSDYVIVESADFSVTFV